MGNTGDLTGIHLSDYLSSNIYLPVPRLSHSTMTLRERNQKWQLASESLAMDDQQYGDN